MYLIKSEGKLDGKFDVSEELGRWGARAIHHKNNVTAIRTFTLFFTPMAILIRGNTWPEV